LLTPPFDAEPTSGAANIDLMSRWQPSVTVAAIIEREGRYLLVEEHTPEGLKLNNPAGHLERGETPEQAVVREALEETGRDFVPEAIVGLYMARFERPATGEDVTYLRVAFCGSVGEAIAARALDAPIVRTLWLTAEEIRAETPRHRSPLLMRCIDDHAAGRRHPLRLIHAEPSIERPFVLR
jgi:8-oxo-dGTP pyrophosphatase MutT (NUDIX family)